MKEFLLVASGRQLVWVELWEWNYWWKPTHFSFVWAGVQPQIVCFWFNRHKVWIRHIWRGECGLLFSCVLFLKLSVVMVVFDGKSKFSLRNKPQVFVLSRVFLIISDTWSWLSSCCYIKCWVLSVKLLPKVGRMQTQTHTNAQIIF